MSGGRPVEAVAHELLHARLDRDGLRAHELVRRLPRRELILLLQAMTDIALKAVTGASQAPAGGDVTSEDIGRLAFALPLAVAQGDDARTDALFEGLDLPAVQALAAAVASVAVQSLEITCESAGVADPKAKAVELLQARALQAAAE